MVKLSVVQPRRERRGREARPPRGGGVAAAQHPPPHLVPRTAVSLGLGPCQPPSSFMGLRARAGTRVHPPSSARFCFTWGAASWGAAS